MHQPSPTFAAKPSLETAAERLVIGVLPGEGIGAEVIAAALAVARAAGRKFGFALDVKTGGDIGLQAKKKHAAELSAEVIDFCSTLSAQNGAILSGPGGGRYVYDLRRHFQLFCKVNPLASFPELDGVSRLKILPGSRPDIMLIRENLEGLYQGETKETLIGGARHLAHTFSTSETQVHALLEFACKHALNRSRRLAVVIKKGALPELSSLWEDCAREIAQRHGVHVCPVDVDFAAYQLINAPESFDVVATPNCFGDILADLGGLFFGSRGLTYGASYSTGGFGVYQTNHGCAYDLAGTDRANPVGQIFSLALLLRDRLASPQAADEIMQSVRDVWAEGWRTSDLMEPGCRLVGTKAMTEKIVAALETGRRRD